MGMIPVGISACLLGQNVRYDGKNKFNPLFAGEITEKIRWVPVCPEVEFGLEVPREPIHLTDDSERPGLKTVGGGCDFSEAMAEFCRKRAKLLVTEGLAGFVFKSRSPSCGLHVSVYQSDGFSAGYFAREWMKCFPKLPVMEAGDANDPEKFRLFLSIIGVK